MPLPAGPLTLLSSRCGCAAFGLLVKSACVNPSTDGDPGAAANFWPSVFAAFGYVPK